MLGSFSSLIKELGMTSNVACSSHLLCSVYFLYAKHSAESCSSKVSKALLHGIFHCTRRGDKLVSDSMSATEKHQDVTMLAREGDGIRYNHGSPLRNHLCT